MKLWRKCFGVLLGAVMASSMAMSAFAQTQTGGPIRIVVPYGVGGGTDSVARLAAIELSKSLNVPVVVENKPGAGGILGMSTVVGAPADGRTLLVTAGLLVQAPALYKNLPFDVVKDLAPVSVLGRGPLVLVGRQDLPGGTLTGFINEAKKVPGKYNYGSVAVASTSHLYGEQLNRSAGIQLTHIPYKGGGATLTALLAKEIDVAILDYTAVAPYFATGQIKPLAINGTQRLGDKAIPTFKEQGLDGFESVGFYGVLAPANTPPDVVATLSKALSEIVKRDEMKGIFLDRFYLEAWGSTPQEFADMMKRDMVAWADIVDGANIKLD